MKKALLLTFSLLLMLAAFSYNRYEFLLGIGSGGGAAFYNYRLYQQSYAYNGGTITTNATEKSIGANIPAHAEVLFGVKGFRMGYQFDFKHGIYSKFQRDLDDNSIAPDFDTTFNTRRNLFGHYFLMEYAIPIGAKGGCLIAATPFFGVGGYRGFVKDLTTGNETKYKDILKNRVTIKAGLNFEFTVRRFCFVVGPAYNYYNVKPKATTNNKGAFHAVSLDFSFRLNLVKPRY